MIDVDDNVALMILSFLVVEIILVLASHIDPFLVPKAYYVRTRSYYADKDATYRTCKESSLLTESK